MSKQEIALLILTVIIINILIVKWRSYMIHKKCPKNKNGWCTHYEVQCSTVNYLCEWEEDDDS